MKNQVINAEPIMYGITEKFQSFGFCLDCKFVQYPAALWAPIHRWQIDLDADANAQREKKRTEWEIVLQNFVCHTKGSLIKYGAASEVNNKRNMSPMIGLRSTYVRVIFPPRTAILSSKSCEFVCPMRKPNKNWIILKIEY